MPRYIISLKLYVVRALLNFTIIKLSYALWIQNPCFFFYSFEEKNLLQINSTYYITYNLLNNTTRTIPRSARCHDNSMAIDMKNT